MKIHFNGMPLELPEACALPELLRLQGLAERRFAVERNGAIVPKSQHAQTQLVDGDRIEVVHAIGGG